MDIIVNSSLPIWMSHNDLTEAGSLDPAVKPRDVGLEGLCDKKVDLIHQTRNYYQNILTCLGYSSDNPPVADLLRQYHKLDGHWLIISPIHWQATHNDAMIMACDDTLDLSDTESRLWFAALNQFLAQDTVKLHYHDAYTWLIQFETSPSINARPVHQLLQQSMMQHLQAMDSTLFWSRFITENQMFFSEHSLNKARAGRYPINGVWVWGGGDLNHHKIRTFFCNDEAGFGLAGLLTTDVRRFTESAAFPKDSVLLFSTIDASQVAQFKKNTVHWYWNNASFVTKSISWFARLMGR